MGPIEAVNNHAGRNASALTGHDPVRLQHTTRLAGFNIEHGAQLVPLAQCGPSQIPGRLRNRLGSGLSQWPFSRNFFTISGHVRDEGRTTHCINKHINNTRRTTFALGSNPHMPKRVMHQPRGCLPATQSAAHNLLGLSSRNRRGQPDCTQPS